MPWFVLNHIAPAICCNRTASAEIDAFNRRTKATLELFAPTFIKMVMSNGVWKRKNSPLLFHYVFVNGTESDIKALAAANNGFSLIPDTASQANNYLTVSDNDMRSFKIIAQRYGNEIPCFTPDEIDLQEGDIVEVATGPFAGLRGIYIARKGASSGAVCLSLTGGITPMALDVSADYLRILQYAQGSKRPYDHIAAFEPRLLKAAETAASGNALPAELIATLTAFTRRMGAVEIASPRLRTKLNNLLAQAEQLLHNSPHNLN